ncbi:MAG: hypothetical protein JO318_13880 [Chloroflexi bacterium]|nr:hypothetical protein [Chloroflexota bacterium]
MRAIAVDWSGATHTARSHIWLAEAVQPGQLVRLEAGRDRDGLCAHLLSLPPNGSTMIGFDFAFSFPGWYLEHLDVASAPELWTYVARCGEAWLSACEPPFWGRPGRARPVPAGPALRRTDLAVPRTGGIAPKSIFQIGGAGAVGTGSIRGMPLLDRLLGAGMRVWPFTDAGAPTVVEIYPRLLTGPVRKSNAAARAAFVGRRYPALDGRHRALAIASEDAFDAAVSALVMIEHVAELSQLPPERDSLLRLEGRIWHPRWREDLIEGPVEDPIRT